MSQVSTVHLLGSTALVCLSEILKRDLPQQNILCPCTITVDTTAAVFLQQNSKDLQTPFTLSFVCDAGGQPANTSRRRPCGYLWRSSSPCVCAWTIGFDKCENLCLLQWISIRSLLQNAQRATDWFVHYCSAQFIIA